MAGRKKAPMWRQAFLRALKRTGNVRASAFEAGVDPGTTYDHRAKDAGFRAKWAGALKAYRARPSSSRRSASGPSLSPDRRAGKEELVLRRSTAGDRLVRAAPGRWSARVEESFLDGLGATGSVRLAAQAAGISTTALYERRKHYPEFAARWDEVGARAGTELPVLLNVAAVQSMTPQPEGAKRRGRARLPKLDADQSIRILAINENAKGRGSGRRGGISAQEQRPKRSEAEEKEEVGQELAKLLGMVKRRREKARLAEGWTRVNGIWLPPGWTATPPPGWTPPGEDETGAPEDGEPPAPGGT